MGILDRLDDLDRRTGLDRVIPYVPLIVGVVMVGSALLAALGGGWIRALIAVVLAPVGFIGLRRQMNSRGTPTWPTSVDAVVEDLPHERYSDSH